MIENHDDEIHLARFDIPLREAGGADAKMPFLSLASFLERSPGLGCILTGPDHVFRFANRAYQKLVGERPLLGLSARSIFVGIAADTIRCMDRVYETGAPFFGQDVPVELDWNRDGERSMRFFNLCVYPLFGPTGKITGIWSMGTDVTEYHLALSRLRSAEKMASLGLIAASVAHEINNPLTYVISRTDSLLEDAEEGFADGESLKRDLKDIREGVQRVAKIVRDLKVYSRQELPVPEPADLRAILDSALSMAANELKHRARALRDYQAIPVVLADASKLTQVFLNLIVNAAQSIPEGRALENEVVLRTYTSDEGWAVVEIQDTGCGIAPELAQRVFEPFFTTKPCGMGTGLGLSVSRDIVGEHGGRIELRSIPDRGSRFSVHLPPATNEASGKK